MSLFVAVRDYIDTLIHPSARGNVLAVARHRAFITPRLIGGLLAVLGLPVYFAIRGVPSSLETGILAWLVVPVLLAYFLARTGKLEQALIFSSLALAGLIVTVAVQTGGVMSFAAVWLIIVPAEAALSASRRVTLAACAFAIGAACLLFTLGAFEYLPPAIDHGRWQTLAFLGLGSAAFYAGGLALGTESVMRTAAQMLGATEARYGLLAQSMSDVVTRHGRNGAVMFVSPAAETMFGLPLNELRGHGLFDRIHVTDRPSYLTALDEAASKGKSCTIEFRIQRAARDPAATPSMHFIWIEMRCRPLDLTSEGCNAHGHCDVVAVMRDITERKAQQKQLREARTDAEHANAAKSRFLAAMSHELRTPLNAIIGFSEMLMNEQTMNVDKSRRSDYARMIHESGGHLLSVVDGVLDVAKIETGNFSIAPERFALPSVISVCCDLLALRAREEGVDLAMRVPPDLPGLVADKRAVRQILINLLSNAIKFTPRGGKVTVSARADAKFVTISVADTGVGIEQCHLPYLGDPFFQVRGPYDRPHDGSGLGLSIVKGLVALHQGHFEIESEINRGTCVSVQLPVQAAQMRPASKTRDVPVIKHEPRADDVGVLKSA
ncbi:MAG TPA: ATP-binding protein [Xanthobacteraceae bacterium]|nr:ATP-binding protein [Xanthobacteraceae bacterium]